MAIWRGKSAVPTNGPSIHVMHKPGSGGDKLAGDVGEAVGLARIMLRQVLTMMNKGPMGLSADQLQILDYYFVLGGNPPSSTTFDVIMQTLKLVQVGINGPDLNVKVTMAGDAMGYVNMNDGRSGTMNKIRMKLGMAKKGWTPGIDIDDNQHKTHFGTIHLDSDRLETGPELSAKTFIHEAAHKFASVTDYGTKGYTNDETGHFRADGLTHAEAINNAESYARFVMYAFLAG